MSSDANGHVSTPAEFSYTLRIGVSGHRNIADPTAVRHAVDGLLDTISQTLQPQSRTPLSWTVISPLAKGADRIVAFSVLARRPARLEVLTPFELDEYRRDFEAGEDRDAFEELLATAEQVDEVTSQAPPPGASDEERTEWRNRGYLRVGRRVVEACELLIVVWDGQPARGTGGTGDIVAYALQQERTVIWIHATDPRRAPCLLTGWQPGQTPQTRELPTTPKDLSLGYHQFNAYQRDTCVSAIDLPQEIDQTSCSLRRRAEQAGVDAAAVDALVGSFVPHFVRADRLAVHYGRRYVRATTGLFLLAAIAVSVVVGQVLFFPNAVWLILFEILAMGGAVGLWFWCRREAWHEKWIHDRYLAERLRMASFGYLLDTVDTTTSRTPPAGLAFYAGPNQWIVDVVSQVIAQARAAQPAPTELANVRQFLVDSWLEDQRQYHARNAQRHSRAAHRGHRAGTVLFVLTLILAIGHLIGVGHPHDAPPVGGITRLDLWITFGAIVLPAWGGAIHAITTQLELERVAARSKRMAQVLGVLIERAQEAQTIETLRAVVAEAQQLMRTENHEWWILLSFRQPVLSA
jgi:hypothetical protein